MLNPLSVLSGTPQSDPKYSIFGDNLRTYIWQGDAYPVGDPNAGLSWCFAYGEKEWLAGKIFSKVYEAAKGDLLADPPIAPVGRYNCTTGALIP